MVINIKISTFILMMILSVFLYSPFVIAGDRNSSSIDPWDIIELNEDQVGRLKNRICRMVGSFQGSSIRDNLTFVEKTEKLLLRYSQISAKEGNYRERLTTFWNRYDDKMICAADGAKSLAAQHFYSRAITNGYQEAILEDYFFSNASDFPIDPNVVFVTQNEEKQTVLDFIDNALAPTDANIFYNVSQVKKLKEIVEKDFEGLRFSQLQYIEK